MGMKSSRQLLVILNVIFSAQFSNAISSEVPGPIDFKFYVRHPGEVFYQSYQNYADSAIFPHFFFIFFQASFQTLCPLKFVDQ